MFVMHHQIYKWSILGEKCQTVWGSLHREWVRWKCSPVQLSEKKDLGQGCGHPRQTCDSQADKGVFRKVMNRRVRERRRLGRGGRGSLFPSGLVGSKDEPEPRQSGRTRPGLWGFGPRLGTLESRSGRGEREEAPPAAQTPSQPSLNLREGKTELRTPSPSWGGGITDPGRPTFHWRHSSFPGPRRPGGAAQRREGGGGAGTAVVVTVALARGAFARTLVRMSCGFFLAAPRQRGASAWVNQTAREVRPGSVPSSPRAGSEDGGMSEETGGSLYCRNQAP